VADSLAFVDQREGGLLTFDLDIVTFFNCREASMPDSKQIEGFSKGDEILLGDTAVLTRLDKAIGWARKFSIFPYPFATACCAMEYMSLSMTPYDIDRFGALLPRFTPRQSDLLMVIGTVTTRQGPILRRVYDQMAEPKWVMAFGACASSGGFYDNYATIPGIDKIIPVDVYVPGCPPRPESVLDGLMALQRKIQGQRQKLLAMGRKHEAA
jgi:NADH-quinone oxidoreductase subunit B